MSDFIRSESIPEWRPSFKRGVHFSMSLFGPRRQGKSCMVRGIFKRYRFDTIFDLFVVISASLGNANDPEFFANFVPGQLQFVAYDPAIIRKIYEKQDEFMSMYGKYMDILIIFDDCVSVKQKYSDEILQIFATGRNKGISVIFTTQSPALMNKVWRDNSDYAILLYEKDYTNRQKLIESYLLGIVDIPPETPRGKIMREMDKLYLDIVKERPYQALVADFIKQKIYKYVSPSH